MQKSEVDDLCQKIFDLDEHKILFIRKQEMGGVQAFSSTGILPNTEVSKIGVRLLTQYGEKLKWNSTGIFLVGASIDKKKYS